MKGSPYNMKSIYKFFSILLFISILVGCATPTPTATPAPTIAPTATPDPYIGTDGFPWWNDTVFYEIFVRSFRDSDGDGIGDFNGITEKLDYLQDLGVKGLWLMPINPSPSYHGYDVTDYYGVNPDYGTMDDFKNLLDEAHKHDIKIIIDFVMNHTSSKHPWFQQHLHREVRTTIGTSGAKPIPARLVRGEPKPGTVPAMDNTITPSFGIRCPI